MNAKMNVKSKGVQFASLALVALMVLCSVPYLAQGSEAAAEMTAADYRIDDGYYYDAANWVYVKDVAGKAVRITDLSATIPSLEGFTEFSASALEPAYYGDILMGYYGSYDYISLSGGETFEAIADLFKEETGLVELFIMVGDTTYRCVVTYDAPVDVISYGVTGTLTAGAITAKAVKTADATADLENAMFRVIAHYSDGKFISAYVPAAAAEDGSLSLSNMGVSTLGLVDVMVGVIGGVPSDEPTEYFGETVLKATA